MHGLEVLLFGGFQLRRHEEPLPPIPSRAARSLLAYLIMYRGVRHPRERLAAQFWPELSAARARRRLSHTLWQIQDALSESSADADHLEVAADALSVRPDAPYRVDVEEFERGLDRLRARRSHGPARVRDLADLEQVVDLYQGDFLAGHYETWVLEEQQRLEQRYLDALNHLVDLARSQGAYDDALTYARRLTNQDPLREDAHREVMRLSTLLGRTSDALRQYERCRTVLADELGTSPSAATEQLHQRILRQRQQHRVATVDIEPEPFPERLQLLGRESERDAAIGVLERALTGAGGAVLVEGDPGAGKSRFLSELVDDGEWRGFQVLAASCRGPEAPTSYGLIRQLLEPALTPLRIAQLLPRVPPVWLGLVAQIVPSIRGVLPSEHAAPPAVRQEEAAQRLHHAVEATLVELAALQPLLVVADDLQWADEASIEVVARVAAAGRDRRIALLLGYRGDELRARGPVWDAIRDIDRRSRAVRVELGPLDAFSIAELVRLVGRQRGLDHSIAARLQRETGGNPLFVVETLRALTDPTVESSAAVGGEVGDDIRDGSDPEYLPLPGSIRDLVLSRLARLSPETRLVLEVAAVAGDGTGLDIVEAATELPREVIAEATGRLVRHSLLRELADGYGLHHDQIRRVVLDGLPPADARALHQRIGDALERRQPGAVEQLAHHFSAAGVLRKAVVYLRSAGRQAMEVHAYAAADRYLTRAITAQRSQPASLAARFDLVAEHETVLDVLGARDRQRRAVEELLTLAAGAPRREAEALRRRALHAAQTGDLSTAQDAAGRALELVRAAGEDDVLPGALLSQGKVLALAGQRHRAVEVFSQAIALPGVPPALELELRTSLASVLREVQRYDEAAAELTVALELADRHGARREEAHVLGVLGTVRMETGHAAEASELYGQAIERCRSIGFRRGEGINLVNQGNVLYALDQVGAALSAYVTAAEVFAELDDQRGEAAVRLNLGFVCHTVLGDDERASRELDAAVRHFAAVGDVPFEAACRDARASVASCAGDLAAAELELERAFALPGIRDHSWIACQLLRRRSELRLAEGSTTAAGSAVSEALDLARQHHLADLEAGLLALQGAVMLAAGDVSGAVRCSEEAVAAVHEGVERSYLVHLQHHDALRAAGRSDDAAAAADRAAGALRQVLDSLDETDRPRAAALPAHRRIIEGGTPAVAGIKVMVAAASAPRGRPLRPVELVEVEVHLEVDSDAPDDPIERRRHLLQRSAEQIVAQGGAATITDLARLLGVSEATVRRDLQALRRAGDVVETRGRRSG